MNYEFTTRSMNPKKQTSLIEYLKKNQGYLFDTGEFVFDTKSLSTPIVLSKCLGCEKYHGVNCCEGSPYPLVSENQNKLNTILKDVLKWTSNYKTLSSDILSMSKSVYTRSGTFIGMKEGGCLFNVFKDDVDKCAIHGYCLDNGLNYMEYKPYICSMYPIFVVRLDSGKKVVFCSNKETQGFTLYWYTLTKRFCVNKPVMDRALSGDAGRSTYIKNLNMKKIQEDKVAEGYLPAYKSQENVLRFFVGESYDKLVERMSQNVI